jgi:hypothetical protein
MNDELGFNSGYIVQYSPVPWTWEITMLFSAASM